MIQGATAAEFQTAMTGAATIPLSAPALLLETGSGAGATCARKPATSTGNKLSEIFMANE